MLRVDWVIQDTDMEDLMYCTACNCEYNGWTGKCPSCKQPLQQGKPQEHLRNGEQINYSTLVEIIKEHGDSLNIPVTASEVTRSKTTRFPWMGLGYAWTQKMHGSTNGITVDVSTTEVGKDRKWAFPYRGHGYAWQQKSQGWVGGNEITLQAAQVNQKRSWSFPYSGYGYAWTEEMTGNCGEEIRVSLKATEVKKHRRWRFPYFGYGYAWVDEGMLTMRLI